MRFMVLTLHLGPACCSTVFFVCAAGVRIERATVTKSTLARPNGLLHRSRDGLAVDKVIHHLFFLFLIIIRPWCRVAGGDPDSCDERLVEHDAEKGKARIARRSRDDTAEEHLVVGAEILNQRASITVFSLLTVSPLLAMPSPVLLVNVCENRPKPTHRCGDSPIAAG